MRRTVAALPTPARPVWRRWTRRLRLLGTMMVIWALALAVGATPAAAHGVGGVDPTNYRTRILAVEPAVSGLSVEVVDAGARLRVRNTTGREVIVFGYASEPYLRLGPDGVFENRRSPAAYLNRVRIAPAAPPADADPTAPPAWRRIGDGNTVAWYDHRAHWMATSDPPAVKAAPDQRHVVIPRWQVPLRAGGQQLEVTGEVRWIPGPSPWPWLAAAVGCLLLVVVVAARSRPPMLLAGLVGLLVLVDMIHTAGIWAGSTASVATKASASLPSVVGWTLGGLAVRRLVGSDPARGHVLVLVAAVLLLLVGGLSDLDSLSASQLAVALPSLLTRSLVALTLGLAGGLTLLTVRPPSPATHQGVGNPPTERGARGAHSDIPDHDGPIPAGGHHAHAGHRGLLGRLRELFVPHRHDPGVAVDTALETSRQGMRALVVSLLALAATALIQAAVVAFSGSVALLGDTLHNFADALTAVPLAIAFRLGRRPPTRRYTYGFGRAEDVAGIVVVIFIAASSVLAGYEAVRRLLEPTEVRHLGLVAAAAVVGFLGNELVARYRIRVGRQIGSAALVADGLHARTDGLTSLSVLAGAGGVALGFELADPLVGLLIAVAILLVLRDAAREVYRRLMDAVDPALVDQVEDVLRATPGVVEVGEVRLRWIGHQLRAECEVAVDGALSVVEGHRIAEEAQHRLLHQVPLGVADPVGHAERDHHELTAHHLRRQP